MTLIAIIWFICIIVVYKAVARSKTRSVGLPLMVLIALSFEYVGGFAYALPGYSHIRADGSLYLLAYNFTDETVLRGMWIALIGVLSFTFGVATSSVLAPAPRGLPARYPFNRNSFHTILAIGLVGLVLTQFSLQIPLIGALKQVTQLTLICAIAFGLYMSVNGIRGRPVLWYLLSVAMPVYYLVMLGFMSYGFQAFVILSVFYILLIAKRPPSLLAFVPGFLAITYIVLCACVLWLSFRGELRDVLWSDAGLAERIDALLYALSNASFLNPFDFQSVDQLVTRLNHGLWVGKVAEFHDLNPELRLHGEGILLAMFAWVPRFLWPGKPEAGGSLLLETHTGHEFSAGSTFGAGQVVDFYINFGIPGVVIGFLLLGLLVSWVDRTSAGAIRNGNLVIAAKYFVLGLCLTRSLSEIFFLVSSGIFAIAVFTAVQWIAPKMVSVRRRRVVLPSRAPIRLDEINSA